MRLCLLVVLSLIGSIVQGQEPATVNLDSRAYIHAQQEAMIQATQQKVQHAMGIAPGCRFAGVGSSGSIDNPRHCTTTKYRLVARAYAIGRNGRVYWSAHYR